MPSDFGDESGEKFCDWLMDIGQQAGQEAMHAAARKLSVALKHTKGPWCRRGRTQVGTLKP